MKKSSMHKRVLKKLALVILSFSLVASTLIGCGKSSNTSRKNQNDNLDIISDVDDRSDTVVKKDETTTVEYSKRTTTFEDIMKSDEYMNPESNYAIVEINGENVPFFQAECVENQDSKFGTLVNVVFYSYDRGEKQYKLTINMNGNLPVGEYSGSDFIGSKAKAKDKMFSLYLYKSDWEQIDSSTDYAYMLCKFKKNRFNLSVNSKSSDNSHFQLDVSVDNAKQAGQVNDNWGEFTYSLDFTVGKVNPVVTMMSELEKGSIGSQSSSNAGKDYSNGNSSNYTEDDDCPRCGGLGDCDVCFGDGFVRCSSLHCSGGDCIECGGDGWVEVYAYGANGNNIKKRRCTYCRYGLCKTCNGTGEVKCSTCNGRGRCPSCGK